MESLGKSQKVLVFGLRVFGPRDFGQGSSQGNTFTMIPPSLFHTFSFFCHPGPVKRDFLHCRQTQSVPGAYHTQFYVVEVQTSVELNPNILVRDVERMEMAAAWSQFGSAAHTSCITTKVYSLGLNEWTFLKLPVSTLQGPSIFYEVHQIGRTTTGEPTLLE